MAIFLKPFTITAEAYTSTTPSVLSSFIARAAADACLSVSNTATSMLSIVNSVSRVVCFYLSLSQWRQMRSPDRCGAVERAEFFTLGIDHSQVMVDATLATIALLCLSTCNRYTAHSR